MSRALLHLEGASRSSDLSYLRSVDLPIALGDVPTWLQAIGGLAQVGHVVWATQLSRASAFAERLTDELDLGDEEIAQAIRDQPELAAIVLDGIEQAMRARTDEKRWLLAKVVGAAFRGDDARLDEIELYLRTAAAVEAADVRVLTVVAKPRPDSLPDVPIVGAIRAHELQEHLATDQQVLLAPIISSLIREGLVADVAVGTLGYEPAWMLTPYGFRFLRFLPGLPTSEFADSTVVGVHLPPTLLLKNLGYSDATVTSVELTADQRPLMPGLEGPVYIAAGGSVTLPADGSVDPNGGARIRLTWTDRSGEQHESERIQRRRG